MNPQKRGVKFKSRFDEKSDRYKEKRALDKSTKIFLVGGGSYLLENLTPVSEIMENAEFYNAIGNLLYAKQMSEK